MIFPPSSSADEISATTLCFAVGDIRGPLGEKIQQRTQDFGDAAELTDRHLSQSLRLL